MHFVRMIAVALSVGVPLGADDSVRSEQLDDILAELQKIRMLLESGQPHRDVQTQSKIINFGVKDAPVLGSKDAPLTIVEFLDYQCPYCQQFHRQTFQDLKEQYIDSQKVRFYVMHLPLATHPNALLAAQAGRCADEQGLFWAIHNRMQSEGKELDADRIVEFAKESDIDVVKFRQCIESGKYKAAIQQGIREANSKGIRGTPAFIIGKSTQTGVEGKLVMGAVPYGIFEQRIKEFTQ